MCVCTFDAAPLQGGELDEQIQTLQRQLQQMEVRCIMTFEMPKSKFSRPPQIRHVVPVGCSSNKNMHMGIKINYKSGYMQVVLIGLVLDPSLCASYCE